MHLRGRRRIRAALIALVLRVAMSLASAHLLHLHDLGRTVGLKETLKVIQFQLTCCGLDANHHIRLPNLAWSSSSNGEGMQGPESP